MIFHRDYGKMPPMIYPTPLPTSSVAQPAAHVTGTPANVREVRRVLWRVLVLNGLVAAAKLVTGIITGSVAMIADGFHSSMDASSNVVGLVGVKLAAQPADADHPYGHRRFETLATLAIGGLLLGAAWEILQTMLDRLLNGGEPTVTPANFAIMIATIVINLVVTLYERRAGRRLRSDILMADAAHTASDFFVSLSVIGSLAASRLGYGWMDSVMALVIVVVIARAGITIISRNSDILAARQTLDPAEVTARLADMPGIDQVVRVRSRGPADAVHVDIDTRINPSITTDHAYAMAKALKERVRAAFPQVEEVQVHFAPVRDPVLNYALEARAVADALGLTIHEVIPVPMQDGIALEMHVEVQPGLSLAEAHRQASELERRLKQRVPRVLEVLTHIEPASPQGAPIVQTQAALELRDLAMAVAQDLYPDADWHKPTIRLALGGYAMTMHCHLAGTCSVEEAHGIAEHVDTAIRSFIPQIQRVTIHTEPRP